MKKLILTLCFVLTAVPGHTIFGIGDLVFDPTNLVQNIQQVFQAITQVRNQITQIENMRQNTRNVKGVWQQLLPQLEQYALRICQGEAAAYCDPNLIAVFRQRWPGYAMREYRWEQDYSQQTQSLLDVITNAMQATQEQERKMQTEDDRIDSASRKSEAAVGRMQVQQSTNMFLAELSHQVMLLRQEHMTAMRITATAEAQRISREARALQMDRNFLLNAAPIAAPSYGASGVGNFNQLGK